MASIGQGAAVTGVRIAASSSPLRIVAEDRDDVAVSGDADVTQVGSMVTVDAVRSGLVVRVPTGVDLAVGTTSARVDIDGRLGNVGVVTESGRIRVGHARSLDARTSSADIEVGEVDGDCRVRSTSGRVDIGRCRDADVSTDSGRIELSGVAGTARAHCVSGRIDIHMNEAGDVDAETVTGRVSVSLPEGSRIRRSGVADAPAGPDDPDCDCTVSARSVSGRVDVAWR